MKENSEEKMEKAIKLIDGLSAEICEAKLDEIDDCVVVSSIMYLISLSVSYVQVPWSFDGSLDVIDEECQLTRLQ